MKILSYLFAISVILSSHIPVSAGGDGRFTNDPPKLERYEIVDDGGGSVDDFKTALKSFKKNGYGLKINGYCASACTLSVAENIGLDVCVTPKASLMIHKPFLVRYNLVKYEIVRTIPAIYKAEQIWETDFYRQYPVWLRTEIDNNGGSPSVYTGSQPNDMFVVGFDTLKKHMTVCSD